MGNDGNWDDLGRITEDYKDLPREDKMKVLKNFDKMMNLWVRKVCSAKGMDMLPYFEFWQFPVNVSPSTSEACNQYLAQPSEIMAWLSSISQLASEGGNCPAGWQGSDSKCYRVSYDKLSYDKAREFCDGLDGATALATIEDRNEAVFVEWAYFLAAAKGLVFIRHLINMICLLISLSIQDVASAQAC